jgi:hypothetical protein
MLSGSKSARTTRPALRCPWPRTAARHTASLLCNCALPRAALLARMDKVLEPALKEAKEVCQVTRVGSQISTR